MPQQNEPLIIAGPRRSGKTVKLMKHVNHHLKTTGGEVVLGANSWGEADRLLKMLDEEHRKRVIVSFKTTREVAPEHIDPDNRKVLFAFPNCEYPCPLLSAAFSGKLTGQNNFIFEWFTKQPKFEYIVTPPPEDG